MSYHGNRHQLHNMHAKTGQDGVRLATRCHIALTCDGILQASFYHAEAFPLRLFVSCIGRVSHVSDISVSSALARPCSLSRASISSAPQRWW